MSSSSGKQGQQRGRTLAAKRGDVRLLTIIVLTCFTLIWVLVRERASRNIQQRSATRMPYTTREHEVVQSESFLPEGTVTLSESRGDVDEDGIEEMVIAFNDEHQPHAGGGGGVLVLDTEDNYQYKAWQTRPSTEGRVTELVLEDMNQDGGLEILLYKASDDETWHYLHVYDWDGSGYVAITPRGGPLDGMEAFISAHYPPEVRNVDSTTLEEIIVFEDDGSSDRLRAVIYRWDGVAYTHTDWIIMLGPPR